jgi:hypothetical protein
MKNIREPNIKNGINEFIESFRDRNDDVTNYASEKVVNVVTHEKKNKYGYSRRKVSDRRIAPDGE